MLTSLVIGGALRFSGNNGWPSVCHWLRLRRNFVSSCALEYNLILRNSADIIVLGHLNRQIVHCRFLSAADLMSLSNAGLDHADTDRVDSQYLAVLMRANTHSLAAVDTMDVNNNLERFFRMLIETLHCFFVSFWMVEIISRLSFDFLLIGFVR